MKKVILPLFALLCLCLLAGCALLPSPEDQGSLVSALKTADVTHSPTAQPTATPAPTVSPLAEYFGEYTLFAFSGKTDYSFLDGVIFLSVGHSTSTVTLEDGGGAMTVNDQGGPIDDWTVKDGVLRFMSGGQMMTGSIRDGILIVDIDEDSRYYYAKAGADTSVVPAVKDSDAFLNAGRNFLFGLTEDGFDRDMAIRCFETAADKGNAEGWYWLGETYAKRVGEAGHFQKAVEYYDKAIEGGCALGYIGKAELCDDGIAIPRDDEQIRAWLQSALDAGRTEANLLLGLLEKDSAACIERLLPLDQHPDYYWRNSARTDIGMRLRSPLDGSEPDYAKAMEWFQKAAEEGFGRAYFHVAYLYDHGLGVEENDEQAIAYYEKAMACGYPSAFVNRGVLYENQGDYVNANSMYEKGMDLGSDSAFINLASNYANGKGVEPDGEKAIELFLRGMEEGESQIYNHNIANIYYKGTLVEQNYPKALEYFLKAADAQYTDAYYMTGIMYRDGLGTAQDYGKAMEYFLMGHEAGDPWCAQQIGSFYENGYGVEQDYAKALEYYRVAADKDLIYACRKLGIFYGDGYGTEIDLAQSAAWFEKGMGLGDADCAANLVWLQAKEEVVTGQPFTADRAQKALYYTTKMMQLCKESEQEEYRNYVKTTLLDWMLEQGWCTQEQYDKALRGEE